MKLEIGHLYTCSNYNLVVYRKKVKTINSGVFHSFFGNLSNWTIKALNCHSRPLMSDQIFMVVEEPTEPDEEYFLSQVHVIYGEMMGWIRTSGLAHFEEVKE